MITSFNSNTLNKTNLASQHIETDAQGCKHTKRQASDLMHCVYVTLQNGSGTDLERQEERQMHCNGTNLMLLMTLPLTLGVFIALNNTLQFNRSSFWLSIFSLEVCMNYTVVRRSQCNSPKCISNMILFLKNNF